MSVIERLYDNAWYVANAAPGSREQLDADVTRTWMARESAREDARRARGLAILAPARSVIALTRDNAAQAEYDRAKVRAAEAARVTDIIDDHAFTITRTVGPGGSMTVEVASCTLLRHASLSVAGRGGVWTAGLTDPQARWADRDLTILGNDPWEALHWACSWIITGRS